MFSVIIPLYNKSQFVSRAIDSVLNQSFLDFELIVVDDGSTDGSGEIITAHYGSKVSLIAQSNQGVSAARNTGIKNATFEYLAFLDADDVWHPDFLFWMNYVIQKFPGIGMLGSSYSLNGLSEKYENPQVSLIEDYFSQADYNTLFTSSSTVLRKDFFENKEGFKTSLTKGEDVDVWFRAFDWFKKACYVHIPLMFYDLKASGSISAHPSLQETILTALYTDDYAISDHFPSWLSFRDKYLTLNLFQYFDSKVNYESGKTLLQQRRNSYPLSLVPYSLPFSFFKFALARPPMKKLIRNYLKFCFRFVYHS